jgi:hypothetical protein
MTQNAPDRSAREEPDRHFEDALSVADRDDLDYEARLDMLQTWLSRIAAGKAIQGSQAEVEGAIIALQGRSKLKMDTPEEQPQTTTYGGVERSNLREYGLRRLLARLRRILRG